MPEPRIDDAVGLALATYADDVLARSRVEFGKVLYWHHEQDKLVPGPLIVSQDANEVYLYDLTAKLRVLGAEDGFTATYWGDYHTHPVGKSWMSQFPSPHDVTSISVVCDLWPNKLEVLYTAPTVQIVQSLMFGDLFILTPNAERARFQSQEEQYREIERIYNAYSKAHESGHHAVGAIPKFTERGQFLRIVDEVLPSLNRALLGRAHIEFYPNPTGAESWRVSNDEARDERADAARRERNRKKKARQQAKMR